MKSELYIGNDQDNSVKCLLCNHYCIIKNGQAGTCKVRRNLNGELISLNYGKVSGFAVDPIEKKPFYHFMPGTSVLSFGTPGCNFSCLNCQNSELSQSVRRNSVNLELIDFVNPQKVVDLALKQKADGIAYTYSEPSIFFEFARDVVLASRKSALSASLFHLFISNAYFSREMFEIVVREKLFDAINIDLKFINNTLYRKICGAELEPVLENIRRVFDSGIHLEIINLIIPDENDSSDDLLSLCKFISSVSKDIPLHFSRFFPRNKMLDHSTTSDATLLNALKIAKSEGIKYVYLGNTDLHESSDTYCPSCHNKLIERDYYKIRNNILTEAKCPICHEQINFILRK